MSTAALYRDSYMAPTISRSPSYSVEPHAYEHRIALNDRLLPRLSGNFVKQTKDGSMRLRLDAQENGISLPVYGSGCCIAGKVELFKTDGVMSVEVKIEGKLYLKEIAEGGTASTKLCLDTVLLWIRNPSNIPCPQILPFSLYLPETFLYKDKTYPIPPTYHVKLHGLPGFSAAVDYSICAVINKHPSASNLVKSSLFAVHGGNRIVSTPFIYYPRTRPTVRLPRPLLPSRMGFVETREWKRFESVIHVKVTGCQDIITKFYLPASRIFCISQPIPFHLTFSSSAFALASFLPFSPSARGLSTKRTCIQLVRQSAVDVRNDVVMGTKTDIWRLDTVGEGTFKHAGDGTNWISFSGEIVVSGDVKVPGFQAGGLTIKDCIVLSMTPPDPTKCPFSELRKVVPVRLTTDAWMPDGTVIGANDRLSFSLPPTPPELGEETVTYAI